MHPDNDELVPDPQVCRDFNITPMTLWRWDRDDGLGFPPPVKIRNRNYRSRRALNEFRDRKLREAIRGALQRASGAFHVPGSDPGTDGSHGGNAAHRAKVDGRDGDVDAVSQPDRVRCRLVSERRRQLRQAAKNSVTT